MTNKLKVEDKHISNVRVWDTRFRILRVWQTDRFFEGFNIQPNRKEEEIFKEFHLLSKMTAGNKSTGRTGFPD